MCDVRLSFARVAAVGGTASRTRFPGTRWPKGKVPKCHLMPFSASFFFVFFLWVGAGPR